MGFGVRGPFSKGPSKLKNHWAKEPFTKGPLPKDLSLKNLPCSICDSQYVLCNVRFNSH